MFLAWWPTLGCCRSPPSPCICVWANWWTNTLVWEMPQAEPTPPGAPPTSCGRPWAVRYAGTTGQLTVRADSGFNTYSIVALCRKMKVRFSITVRQHRSLRDLIEAIPEDAWTPIPCWMEGAAAVVETSYTPFQGWLWQDQFGRALAKLRALPPPS